MGLDVYLVHYKDYDKTIKLEEEYEKLSSQAWEEAGKGKKYNQMTEEEKEVASTKTTEFAKTMGLGEFGEDSKNKIYIKENSKISPKHLFKIGYFRSSYNAGGINTILQDSIGEDLYDIFSRSEDDEYCSRPDWQEVWRRCDKVIKKFKEHVERCPYLIMKVNPNSLRSASDYPGDEKAALEIFLKVKEKHTENSKSGHNHFTNFSNIDGEFFFGKPLKVVAVLPGINNSPFIKTTNAVENVCYIVFEPSDKKHFEWYLEALEIIKETCEWVLKKEDIDNYYLHWSG